MRASVVIPVVQPTPWLSSVADTLYRQANEFGDVEILWIDAGWSKVSASPPEWVGAFRNARWLEPSMLRTVNCALDLGWRSARSEIVCFLDANILPGPRWLSAIVNSFIGEIDVVSGARKHVNFGQRPIVARDLSWASLVEKARVGQHPGVFAKLEAEIDRLSEQDCWSRFGPFSFIASNVAVAKSRIARTPGFNHAMPRFADLELGFRLWEANARFAYCREALAIHLAPIETDWLSIDELAALFVRHPYKSLIEMQLWAEHNHKLSSSIDRSQVEKLLSTLPFRWTVTGEEFVQFLAKSEDLEPRVSEQWMERAKELEVFGFAQEQTNPESPTRYDRTSLMNWTLSCAPLISRRYQHHLQEHDLSAPLPETATYQCVGQYTITLPRVLLAPFDSCTVNVPLPISRVGQKLIEIRNAHPPELAAAIARARKGVAVNTKLEGLASKGDTEDITIRYDFELKLEWPCRDQEEPNEPARDALPDDLLDLAKEIVAVQATKGDVRETVDNLLDFLAVSVCYGNLPPGFGAMRVLDTGLGDCGPQIDTLFALLRIAGISARKVFGAALGPGGEEKASVRKQVRYGGFSPFRHCWGEFYEPGFGWLPIEIRGYGKRTITPLTVPDSATVRDIQRVEEQRYPFGLLHPFRIATGPMVAMLPLVVAPDADRETIATIIGQSEHDLDCIFRRLDENIGMQCSPDHRNRNRL